MTNLSPKDRLIREPERLLLTTISRAHAWRLEKRGLFPKRIRLGHRCVVWKLSEIMEWLNNHD